jgi:hypothetical protein
VRAPRIMSRRILNRALRNFHCPDAPRRPKKSSSSVSTGFRTNCDSDKRRKFILCRRGARKHARDIGYFQIWPLSGDVPSQKWGSVPLKVLKSHPCLITVSSRTAAQQGIAIANIFLLIFNCLQQADLTALDSTCTERPSFNNCSR